VPQEKLELEEQLLQGMGMDGGGGGGGKSGGRNRPPNNESVRAYRALFVGDAGLFLDM